MKRQLDPQTVQNLRRWQETGGPRRWVETHRGQWNNDDWLNLLSDLQWFGFWPMAPEAIGQLLEETRIRWRNLRRWLGSGEAYRWVNARRGEWNHADWLDLLTTLQESSFWPLDPVAVGELLNELAEEWRALRRWQDAGAARHWVEAHEGQWDHQDFLSLLQSLNQSAFWPLNPDQVKAELHRATAEWWNLQRWQQTGQPERWVAAQQGEWNHTTWLSLLEALYHSPFWPLDPTAVGQLLEQVKRQYWNLRHWLSTVGPVWLQAHQGQWTAQDLLALRFELQGSEYWPIDMGMLEVELEGLHSRHSNLQRWLDSGQARQWVAARGGSWGHTDWEQLLLALRDSSFWPMQPDLIAGLLQRLNLEWWNLHRWQQSGFARNWVDSRQGRWAHSDWLTLLAALQKSEFWPVHPESLREVLDKVTAEWRTAQREQTQDRPRLQGPHPPVRQAG